MIKRQGRGKAASTLSAAPDTYRDHIIKSVMDGNEEALGAIVTTLKQTEIAKGILQAKRYSGTTIDAMAALVPNDRIN